MISLKFTENEKFNMVDDESREALFEAEFENDDCQSLEELFSEALEIVKDARRIAERMQRPGVSPANPVVENKARALAAKGKGGHED